MAAGGGAPWAERARVVGTQIRNRFRVAPVDRRWLWRRADGRVATEAVRRWSDRVRTLLQGDRAADQSSTSTGTSIGAAAKPSSSALRFYRKKVGKEVDGIEDSVIFRSLQALAVPLIGNACYVFMHGLNSVQIYGAEKLHQALQERPKGKPLLTVSNHVAAMDDPFVIASLLPPSVMLEAQKLRWTLCATDRCFTNPILSTFFRSVKVLPVSRGDGIYQKLLQLLLKASQDKRFVCEEAEKAMRAMAASMPPLPLLKKLKAYVHHANVRVRAKAAVAISHCAARMDIAAMKEFGMSALLQVAAELLNDRLPEAREAARSVVGSMHGAFTKEAADKGREEEDAPSVAASWESLCSLSLPPISAQAVAKIAASQ